MREVEDLDKLLKVGEDIIKSTIAFEKQFGSKIPFLYATKMRNICNSLFEAFTRFGIKSPLFDKLNSIV